MSWAGIAAAALLACLLAALGMIAYLRARQRLQDQQAVLIARHAQEVQHIYLQMRGWRHDYRNHIQTMKAYRALGQNDLLDDYLQKLDEDLTVIDPIIKSGNLTADAILNSKLSIARSQGVQIHAKAQLPEALSISQVELCVILGNLLDNAVEACLACPDAADRFLRLYLCVRQGQLYLSITNASSVRPRKQAGLYISRKGSGHGLGLMRVRQAVKRLGGYLEQADEDGAFTTELLIPL